MSKEGAARSKLETLLPVFRRRALLCEKRGANSDQHRVEQNVAGKEGGTAQARYSPLSLPLETKSRKVYSRSLPIARRGSDDGRHMGDSPGAHKSRAPSSLFSFPFGCPWCGPDFMHRVCARKRAAATASPLRRNDSAKTWRRREIVRVTHR